MHAALVTDFDTPPRYREVPDPVARSKHETVVKVLAAGLHPRVRSQADGSHYTSTDELPLIPGVDAVVRDVSGQMRYAIVGHTAMGTMAELTVIEADRSIALPPHVDPVTIAAAMNPAMSSWVALRRRVELGRGQSVLVIGATGNAGRMAVQVARRLGASRVVGAGRDQAALGSLAALGADEVLPLDQLARAADVDIVLDYLWGQPTATAMVDMIAARTERSKRLAWVQIGSVAGLSAPIPSAVLRAARLEVVGSGIGSVPGREWLEELPALVDAVAQGEFDVRATAVPLADVEQAWTDTSSGAERIVLVP